MNCRQAKSFVKVQELPNYDKKVAHHILFLDFLIFKEKSSVRAELVNGIAGSGKMKAQDSEGIAHTYRIKAVHYFNDKRAPIETFYEHPLFRSAEVFSQDGSLTQSPQLMQQGSLSIRFQEDPARQKIELYSVTPQKGAVKIYSLLVKR